MEGEQVVAGGTHGPLMFLLRGHPKRLDRVDAERLDDGVGHPSIVARRDRGDQCRWSQETHFDSGSILGEGEHGIGDLRP